MSINIEFADRLKELPPYLFVEIDKARRGGVWGCVLTPWDQKK